jgi:hypothetical protein
MFIEIEPIWMWWIVRLGYWRSISLNGEVKMG